MRVGVFMVEAPSGKPLLANQQATELLGRNIVTQADKTTLTKVYQAYKNGTDELYPEEQLPLDSDELGYVVIDRTGNAR